MEPITYTHAVLSFGATVQWLGLYESKEQAQAAMREHTPDGAEFFVVVPVADWLSVV